jgi:hypothetical protein
MIVTTFREGGAEGHPNMPSQDLNVTMKQITALLLPAGGMYHGNHPTTANADMM